MTTPSWYLVKSIPDLYRNEPVNVGLVVTAGDDYAARFVGERQDGTINGQAVPSSALPSVAVYNEWVQFVRRAAGSGSLDERIERLTHRLDSITIERRGELLDVDTAEISLPQIVEDLYAQLVTVGGSSGGEVSLERAAERAIRRLDLVEIEQDYEFAVTHQGATHEVHFDYRAVNGRTTLLDRIKLGGIGKARSRAANDLMFRIERALEVNIDHFVTLHSEPTSEEMEQDLQRIEQYGPLVDVTQPNAAEELAFHLGVGLLPEGRRATMKMLSAGGARPIDGDSATRP